MSNRLLVGYSQLQSASNCDAKLSFTFVIERCVKCDDYAIVDGTLLSGILPPNKHKLMVAWALAVSGKQPFKIRGLNQ
jgi:hypothetical protein